MVVNLSGALGDISWVNNTPEEPVLVSFHALFDPFSPFFGGAVINPVTEEFVIDVAGSREIIGAVNGENGLLNVNASTLGAANEPTADAVIEARHAALSQVPIPIPGGGQSTLGTANLYPFAPTFMANGEPQPLSGQYDWHDQATLEVIVDLTNAATGGIFDLNADTLLNNALLTNPNLSAESANAYIDTIMTFFYPRAFLALDLDEVGVNVNQVPLIEAGMEISPNPSSSTVRVKTDNEFEMIDLGVYDITGKLVQFNIGINTTEYTLQRQNLPPGVYVVKARFENGIQTQKLVFE